MAYIVIDLELASDVVSPRPEGYDFDDGLENSWQQELEYKAVPGSSTSEATLVITSNRGSSRTVLALEAGTSEPASSSKPFSTNKPTNWTPASLQEFTARNYQLAQRPPAPFVGAGFDDPLSAVTLSGVGTVPSHPTASPNPTVSYPTLSSAVRASMLPIDPDLTAGGPTQASADPQDSAEPKSPTVASALPSIANGFTEPPQLPPLPVQRATAKDKENRAPKARAAVGQGKFALHNYKKKDTGKAIYAHIWAAIDGNKKLKTSDFNAAWNALSSEAQSHYNNQVGQPGPLATNTAVGNYSASPTDPRNMTAVTGPVGEKGDVYYWPDNVIFSWELVEAEDIQWELLDAEEEKGPEEALKGEEKNVEREGEIKHTYPPRPGYELKRTRTTSLQLGELARQDEEELMRSEAGERMKLEIEALQRLQEEDEKFAQLHAEEVRLLEEERIRARRDAEEQAIKMEELAKIELEKHRRFQEEERKKLEMENLERLKRQQEENVVAKQQVVEVERLGEIACPARLDEEAQRKGAEEDRLRLESAEKEERMRLRKEEKRRKVMEKRERQAREIQAQA
ncbi:hypothetical protein DFP72DRAFT_1181054 [Ephemerocybe angulata]|uniref:Uncharacterized protein n=1 Tax=Ephemerocybe angulata TaxID=980116 RepID=A0A8H6LUG7_9AGAR|nr:hypothetical protein DFP72DRAFT_1181054 [Tulosesus angulatus]